MKMIIVLIVALALLAYGSFIASLVSDVPQADFMDALSSA